MNSRIQHKYDTAENWGKAVNFIPKAGEIIVYSDGIDGVGVPAIKIGDGKHVVNELEFAGNYYKDLTAEFNAQMEEGNITSAEEFLLQQSITGKYYIYDYNHACKIFYCEVNEYDGTFYHTITSYSDDGFKEISEYVRNELVSLLDHADGGTNFHTPVFVTKAPEYDDEVANKGYIDNQIKKLQPIDCTEDFAASEINNIVEYLLNISDSGKYHIENNSTLYYCEVKTVYSMLYHTITSYSDDGFKHVSEYINAECVSSMDFNETIPNEMAYHDLHVINVLDSEYAVVNKQYIDNLITVEDIDAICGTTIQMASSSEVTF